MQIIYEVFWHVIFWRCFILLNWYMKEPCTFSFFRSSSVPETSALCWWLYWLLYANIWSWHWPLTSTFDPDLWPQPLTLTFDLYLHLEYVTKIKRELHRQVCAKHWPWQLTFNIDLWPWPFTSTFILSCRAFM